MFIRGISGKYGGEPTYEIEKNDTKEESVNHPDHYNKGDVECIDAIESALGKEGFEAWLVGSIIKYLWRYKHKNGVEDLKKAKWYMDRLVSTDEPASINVTPGCQEYIENGLKKLKETPVRVFDDIRYAQAVSNEVNGKEKTTAVIGENSMSELMRKIRDITSCAELLMALSGEDDEPRNKKRKENQKANESVEPR